jgi:thymidylate synthase
MSYDEQYKQLTKLILEHGTYKNNRTNTNTKSTFGKSIEVDLSEGFPILTLRKIAYKMAIEETLFFLSGQTDTKILENKNINIWKGNTSREFLDSRGLHHLDEGDMGKGYGYQWRKFNDNIDQVVDVLNSLRDDPFSRRHIITAWNPNQQHEMALPPCHIMQQYVVNGNYLDSCFYMRSNDFYLGNPFNMIGYAFLNHIFAKWCNRKPGKMVFFGADIHIYENAFVEAEKLLNLEPFPSPQLLIMKPLDVAEDVLTLTTRDLEVFNYSCYKSSSKVAMII